MRVRAKLKGGYYDNKRRAVGEVFDINDAKFPKGHAKEGQVMAFSEKWMEKVDGKSKVELPKKEQVKTPQASASEESSGDTPPEEVI